MSIILQEVSKLEKPEARVTKKTKKQITNIRNETWDSIGDPADIKRIIREQYE